MLYSFLLVFANDEATLHQATLHCFSCCGLDRRYQWAGGMSFLCTNACFGLKLSSQVSLLLFEFLLENELLPFYTQAIAKH